MVIFLALSFSFEICEPFRTDLNLMGMVENFAHYLDSCVIVAVQLKDIPHSSTSTGTPRSSNLVSST